ncbi:MAG: hypothetical protein Q7S43_01435, partial [bacterium]|nr:hypothetical protein [bacterium]
GSVAFDGFTLLNSNASVSGNFEVTGTGSSSFAGSINVAKGLTTNSFQGGGLTLCTSAQKIQYSAGQFSCVDDDDIPEVGDFAALVGGLAIDNNSGTLDFDPTELINNRTWSDGATDASIVWTYNLNTGTDPTITFNPNSVKFGQDASVSANFEISGYASASTWFGNRYASQSWNFDLSGTDIALKFNNNNFTFSGDVSASQDFDSLGTGSSSFTGSLNVTKGLTAGNSFYGASLSDCDADNQTLAWDAARGTFSCGDDDSGGSLFTDDGTKTYLTSTTDDLTLGGTSSLSSPFWMDVSEGVLSVYNVIEYQYRFREDFNRDIAQITANASLWGDCQCLYMEEGGSATANISNDTTGTYVQMVADAASDGWLTFIYDAGAASQNLIFNLANKPVVVVKFKPTEINTGSDIFIGLSTVATAGTASPSNGIWFGNDGDTSSWQAHMKQAASEKAESSCGVGFSTTQFALLRIEALSTTQARFAIDGDLSDGISFTDCGTLTLGTALSAQLGLMVHYSAGAAGEGDVDFIQVSQDDPVGGAGMGESIVPLGPAPPSPIDNIATADIAEAYFMDDTDTVMEGDLLSIDESGAVKVRKTNKAYDRNLMGVVTTSPYLVMGEQRENSDGKMETINVALAGRVPVNVNSEGGPILPGDYLTASSVPGQAMKATKAGPIIGRALEAYGGPKEDILDELAKNRILIFIAPSMYTGEFEEGRGKSGTELLTTLLAKNAGIPEGVESKDIENQTEIFADRIIAAAEIVAERIYTSELFTKHIKNLPGENLNIELSGDSRLIIKNPDSDKEVAVIDNMGNATFAGELRANRISASEIVGLEVITGQISNLSSEVAKLSNGNENDLELKDLIIDGPIEFIGSASFGLITADTIRVNNIESSMLASLSGSFELLASRSGGFEERLTTLEGQQLNLAEVLELGDGLTVERVSVLNGGLRVDEIGSLSGAVRLLDDAEFFGRPYFNSDTGGFLVVQKGATYASVSFENAYLNQPVVNAAITINTASASESDEEILFSNDIRHIITNKSTKGFTVKLNKPAPFDIQFSWIALAIKNAKTFFSPISQTESTPGPTIELTPEPTLSPTPESIPIESIPESTPEVTPEITPEYTSEPTPEPSQTPELTPELVPESSPEVLPETGSEPELNKDVSPEPTPAI